MFGGMGFGRAFGQSKDEELIEFLKLKQKYEGLTEDDQRKLEETQQRRSEFLKESNKGTIFACLIVMAAVAVAGILGRFISLSEEGLMLLTSGLVLFFACVFISLIFFLRWLKRKKVTQ